MGIFSRKSKANAIDFSREFYDQYIFGSVRGVDLEATYAEVVRKNICELDSSFAAVSLEELTEELRAVHLEMIGTAWTHQSKPEVASTVSKFTKQYLADLDRSDLWDAMFAYNQIVAKSAKHGADEPYIASIDKSRIALFEDLLAGESDREEVANAIARVANRIGAERSCKTGITQGFVGIRLMCRLEIEGSDQIVECLAPVVHGFYQGATEALDKVKLTV